MSALATLNGSPVMSGTLFMPLVGPWVADVTVDADTNLSGSVSLLIKDQEFKGTVRRGGVQADSGSYRILGGAGGLNASTQPRSYRLTPLRIPLVDILTTAGESLASLADTAVTGAYLPAWVIMKSVCGQALASLVESQTDANWRILADGTTWVGLETWAANDQEFNLALDDKTNGRRVLNLDSASLRPGQVFDGQRICSVAYEITDDADVLTTIWEATP